ncbi:MAG: hypothetical protein DWQ10_14135 [Calditrichaeota bacterium]|nr:MAG: hypothetical protein DWQ10_14135 [Calditrichota bacterium]
MKNSFNLISKQFVIAGIFFVFSAQNLFSQGLIKGKMIKRGLWKNQSVEYLADELCVFFKGDIESQDALTLLDKYQGQLSMEIDKKGFTVVIFPDSTDVLSIATQLENSSLISAIEPNTICRISSIPNDTHFLSGKQWALYNYGQNPPDGTYDADIDMLKAWDIVEGLATDTVAVLDTGIPIENGSLSHGDLDDTDRFLLGEDYSGETDDTVKDENGHGTHVLGIVGAETNNNEGIAGVVKNGKFLIVQVFDEYGEGTAAGFYHAVEYAVDYGAKVINFSGAFDLPDTTVEAAVSYAGDNDVLIIASMGNLIDDQDTDMDDYPATYSSEMSNLIAVSATDHEDQYSTFAKVNASTNIFAPGEKGGLWDYDDIYSTTPNDTVYFSSIDSIGPDYDYMAGTSMATPHVSGVAALILAINSTLSPSHVRTIIETSADQVYDSNYNVYLPRLNAYEA